MDIMLFIIVSEKEKETKLNVMKNKREEKMKFK